MSITETEAPTYTVGQSVPSAIRKPPLGTVVRRDAVTYVFEPDGWHHTGADGGSGFPLQMQVGDRNVTVDTVGTQPDEETFEQYAQRFMTVCRGAAYYSSVPRTPVYAAFEALGLNQDQPWRIGMWVHPFDQDIVLPGGTLARSGDPDVPDNFGVFALRVGAWSPMLGRRRAINDGVLQVVALPDGGADWSAPVGDQRVLIEEFKARAWEIGVAAKRTESWCEAFERAMGRCGIFEPPPTPVTPPATGTAGVTGNQIEALPDGAVILWSPPDGRSWCLLQRDRSSRWATRYLAGPNTAEHTGLTGDRSDDRVSVAWDGQGAFAVTVRDIDQMDQMPVGTVVADCANGCVPLTKTTDGWGEAGMTSGQVVRDFGTGEAMRYIHIPRSSVNR